MNLHQLFWDLSPAKNLTVLHFSLDKLEYLKSCLVISKSSFSTWLKNTSKQGCPLGGFQVDFVENAGVSLNSCVSSRKYHFKCILLQKSLKSCLSSGSLIFCCIGAKSSPFSNTSISASVNIRWLRLNIISKQKYAINLLSDVLQPFWKDSLTCFLILWDLFSDFSERFNKSSSICNISPSTSSFKVICLLKQSEELLEVEVSLQSLGGDVWCWGDIFSSVRLTRIAFKSLPF